MIRNVIILAAGTGTLILWNFIICAWRSFSMHTCWLIKDLLLTLTALFTNVHPTYRITFQGRIQTFRKLSVPCCIFFSVLHVSPRNKHFPTKGAGEGVEIMDQTQESTPSPNPWFVNTFIKYWKLTSAFHLFLYKTLMSK